MSYFTFPAQQLDTAGLATSAKQDTQITEAQATNTKLDTLLLVDFATEAKQDTQITEAQSTNTKLDTLLLTDFSTEAKQDTQITEVQATNTKLDTLISQTSALTVKEFMTTPVLDASVTQINASAGALVDVATLANNIKQIKISDTTGEFIGIYNKTGPVLLAISNPGADGILPLVVASGVTISIRNMANANINLGKFCIEFIG